MDSAMKAWVKLEVTHPTPWALAYKEEGVEVLGAFASMESRDRRAEELRAEGFVVRTWICRPSYEGG